MVAGSKCKVIEYTEKVCDVYPFSDGYKPFSRVPMAKVATAYDHPKTGESLILIYGSAFYLGDKLEHTLICPNQAHYNGAIIDDVPRHLSHDKSSTHSIYFPDDDIGLPLRLKGAISYIDTRLPSQYDIDNCKWLIVTGDEVWEPHDNAFAENEEILSEDIVAYPLQSNDHELCSVKTDLVFETCRNISALQTTGRKLMHTDQNIAKIFQCSPSSVAIQTRNVTSQKGIHSMTNFL
jgi:hypothetical protein